MLNVRFFLKIFVILLLISLFQISSCLAKLIYDNTGRITFETSNYWYPVSLGEDEMTVELHSISLDKDTAITFKQSKFPLRYKSMRAMNDSEKSVLRDYIMQFYINLMKSKGYSVSVNKTNVLSDAILAGFTLYKNGLEYKIVVMYCIKDYVAYSLCLLGTSYTASELMNVATTLRIDGIPFNRWILE